jgi:hypothetical protein
MSNQSDFARGPGANTRATSGITSPARRTTTVSRRQMSLRRISSSLCSVAFTMVVPPTKTGFRRATGVSAPVRPTWMSMFSISVVASSAGNLCATAQRGGARHEPQLRLLGEAVHLVDDAVDVVGELRALLAHLAVEIEQPRRALRGVAVLRDREAHVVERVQQLRVRGRQRVAVGGAHAVREERQPAPGGELRVQLGAARRPPSCAGSRRSSRPPPPRGD